MAATIWTENRQTKLPINQDLLKAVAQKTLNALACPDAELSVVIVDDLEIHQLNRDFLAHDYPTNVISFAMREGEGGTVEDDLLGDVVISADTVKRDADEAGIPFDDELAFLLIHGILHLTGYDHERGTEEDARLMEAKERELFQMIKGSCLS